MMDIKQKIRVKVLKSPSRVKVRKISNPIKIQVEEKAKKSSPSSRFWNIA